MKRIVQLAGMNGGWSVNHCMSVRRSVEFTAGRFVANVVLATTWKRLAIDHIRRGSPS